MYLKNLCQQNDRLFEKALAHDELSLGIGTHTFKIGLQEVVALSSGATFGLTNEPEGAIVISSMEDVFYNKDCEDINMDRCAQTLISDDVSLRCYAASAHDALYVADVCFDFKEAVLWTADHADTMLEICMLCHVRRTHLFKISILFARTKSGFNSVNFFKLSFSQQSGKWVTTQFSFKKNHRIFDV